jgi:hypothetical protein
VKDASFQFFPDNGLLLINGSHLDDAVALHWPGGDSPITFSLCNGTTAITRTFSPPGRTDSLREILFYGNDGHDTFSNSTRVPAEAYGGRGDDYLVGGSWDDLLDGGDGNDFLIGELGNDTLNGGRGYDNLSASDGEDRLYGGSEDDWLYGGPGRDYIDGGWGDDELRGEGGNDTVSGGADNDTLWGGAGDDELNGDTFAVYFGDDHLYGEGGLDTLQGGPGADYLDGGYDGLIDILYGDREYGPGLSDHDTFVQHRRRPSWYPFRLGYLEEESRGDFEVGADTVRTVDHKFLPVT